MSQYPSFLPYEDTPGDETRELEEGTTTSTVVHSGHSAESSNTHRDHRGRDESQHDHGHDHDHDNDDDDCSAMHEALHPVFP